MPLSLGLTFLLTQFLLVAGNDIVVDSTIVVNILTVMLNLETFTAWDPAITKYIGKHKAKIVRTIVYRCLLAFTLFSVVTWAGVNYIEKKFTFPYDGHANHTLINVILLAWKTILTITIIVNLCQLCLAVISIYFLDSGERRKKKQDRKGVKKNKRRISRSFALLSLSAALNNFGALFKVPSLNISHYLLTRIIVTSVCVSITYLVQKEIRRRQKEWAVFTMK
jgi:hypothetical protein